jgi:putative DNA primase/helicase
VQRLAAGEPVTGGPRFAEILGDRGDRIVACVREWLKLRSDSSPSPGEAGPRGLSCSYLSVVVVIREDRAGVVGGRLALNEMNRASTLDGCELRDVDLSSIRARIEERIVTYDGQPVEASAADIHAAVQQIASERSFHPVREYLSSLVWDGTPRIEFVPAAILHADDTELNRALLRRWFISAVARPMKPGCKVDTVFVLVGDQGFFKSTYFSTLGGDWFCDTAVDIHSKDSYATLQRSWIFEWSELESLRRARDAEAVKAFLSSRRDTYRPPYGRLDVTVPRTSVIVGTTNQVEFLEDETGNRRWWPIHVRAKIDREKLASWRDQLWAEAVVLFRDGEQWWLTPDEEAALASAQEPHTATDPWTEIVLAWAAAPTYSAPKFPDGNTEPPKYPPPVTTANVLRYALEKPVGQWSRFDEMRVAKILKKAKYRQGPRPHGEPRRWIRP